jgi:serine-type D-Ala-D-Ala carboxypeptidase/endopeptidase
MKINMSHPDLTNPIQRFLILLLFIIFLLILMVIKGNAQTQGGQSLIDKLATDYVTDSHNHALNIGIIRNGKQEVFTFGEMERGKGGKPKSNAIFELGTSTEVFTTSLMAILESEGKLSSLDLVADVLKGKVTVPYYQRIICTPPQFNVPMAPEDMAFSRGNVCYPDPNDAPQAMVLCDLATHSAGLPSEPPYNIFNPKNPYANYTTSKLNRYVGNLPPNQAFGFQYTHSLIGMGLLGQALSIKSGKDYETLLKEKILTPLSMTNTFITPTIEQATLFLNGHNSKGKYMIHRDYNALTPAAGIRSSVPDLLQFLDANLSKGIPTEKTDTRFNIALGETHRPRLFTDPADWKYMIGWGWISKPLNEKSKKRVYWRCGEQGGFATFIGFIKDSNIGVVILSNSANRVEDMGMKILEHLESMPATASIR